MSRACEAGIERILAVGSDLQSSQASIELARRYPSIFAAIGIHPHYAEQFELHAKAIRALIEEGKVVAIGEIGLDYRGDHPSAQQQCLAFHAQLAWAAEMDMPVSIHNRNADDDVLAAIQTYGVTAILHCFSGSPAFAARALELGCYISFAGNLTFPRAGELRQVAASIPADRLLVETDAPVLAPQPWRGRRNEPAYIVATVDTLIEVRGEDPPPLLAQLAANADTVFGPMSSQ